jgi:hemerythrin superfamily protein
MPAKPSPRKPKTALDLLKADHAEVKGLFQRFQSLKKRGDTEGMRAIVQAACKALKIHARIEEEIFYPALRENSDATDPLAEANVEHVHIKELVAQLESSQPGDELFEARVKVLSEYVEHHVKEEERTLFAKARKARFDLVALGDQLQARKEELGQGESPIDIQALAAKYDISARRAAGHRARR